MPNFRPIISFDYRFEKNIEDGHMLSSAVSDDCLVYGFCYLKRKRKRKRRRGAQANVPAQLN
ncbi:MAG: hypothetical protein J07HQW1_02102 [Haloquadratum walsbyi J07HQW1]|uniref:Uncharacterized protein n=1 Tax=Haloquadratum walsbyi J07HQW1 TaxID=1238424 RepID=U1PEM1_9EURY|nr:MAG: hypothetical protein J07HQW1_02102 [Haloquadratum walsbyi J07HQW1]